MAKTGLKTLSLLLLLHDSFFWRINPVARVVCRHQHTFAKDMKGLFHKSRLVVMRRVTVGLLSLLDGAGTAQGANISNTAALY